MIVIGQGNKKKLFYTTFSCLFYIIRQISRRAVVPYLALGDYVGSETGKKSKSGVEGQGHTKHKERGERERNS